MPVPISFDKLRSERLLKAIVLFMGGLVILFELTTRILYGGADDLIYPVLGIIVIVITLRILNDWRDGFYIFLVWLLMEDLVRKYMGNNMAIYFGKDFLVGIAYLSFLLALRRRTVKLFKPPFLIAFSLFFWLGVIQAFNPNSPSFLYSILGLKLYFYYAPLIYLGYAIVENEEDLRRFLVFNVGLAGVIALLGVIQSIVGLKFLNPTDLAPEIAGLGNLTRYAPISGAVVSRPTSVFVSDGRFAAYMVLMFIVGLGTMGYLLLRSRKGRGIVSVSVGLTAVAGIMSGSRGAFLYVAGSAVIVSAGMIWGAPWRWRQGHRLVRALQRSAIFVVLGVVFVFLVFPEAILARWSFYSETLSPNSAAYELGNRTWDYPIMNLKASFDDPHWALGNGIGTASLGVQYVTSIMHVPGLRIGVESGYGTLVLELGIVGLLLWFVWTITVVLCSWGVARKLKQTPYFPIAVAITWFAFLLLVLDTFGGFQAFENYINSAYLWLLLGILFRLPTLSAEYIGDTMPVKANRAT
jgi:hypothetical protein